MTGCQCLLDSVRHSIAELEALREQYGCLHESDEEELMQLRRDLWNLERQRAGELGITIPGFCCRLEPAA